MHVRQLTIIAGLLVWPIAGARAQEHPWFVTARAVPAAFGSGATATDPQPGDVPEFGVSSNLRGALALGRRLGRWEFSVGGSFGKHGLRGSGDANAVTLEPAFTLATLEVRGAWALAAWAAGSRLNVFLEPNLQFWSGDAVVGNPTYVGVRGGVGLVTPVVGRLSLDAHAAIGVGPSPIAEDVLADFSSAYDTGALWSRELGIGLRLAF